MHKSQETNQRMMVWQDPVDSYKKHAIFKHVAKVYLISQENLDV